ncbi:cyanophycin synthetase [Ramlibacter sp. WS9]|uniref:ATP-binding protein n=1 Tax=Ramlibacter sp. WS9 TaxID=1882741 RepID=UPI00114263D9|nr:cyanophycin synthetase [Ramlibacter sp. WS9]ROZ75748.1 cyanophycin synthetase [Ramlibacter sp. WS9]
MNAPHAAARPAPKTVTIERQSDLFGLDKSFAQPSVVSVLIVADVPVARGGKSRLTALLDRLRGGAPAAAARRDRSLPEMICDAACDLLRGQGLPVFAKPQCQRIAQRKFQLRIPTVSGAHALTRALVTGLASLANAALAGNPTADVVRNLEELLRQIKAITPKGRNAMPLLATADARGIPWDRLAGNVYRLGQGAKSRWFDSSITDRTPSISVGLARDKQATASVLRSLRLPVPDHILVHTEPQALAAAEKIGFPVVVKPANLDRGLGVVSGLRDNRGVAKAFQAAAALSKSVLIEKHFEGQDHRVHVFEGEVYKVRHRIPGGVTGDGLSTIEDLLRQLNADPARGPRGSGSNKVIIDLDDEALDLLGQQGREPTSVPPAGQFVQLRRIANVSVGGVSHAVPIENVHPDNLAMAVRAVQALRLDLAAVDLLIPDISRSWVDVGAAICEVNAQPQFGEDAPELIFAKIFPDGGRIPIAVVVGNPLDVDWVYELRKRVQAAGKRLGFCSPLGLWIDEQSVDTASPLDVFNAAALLIGNQAVDALLLIADDSLLRHGLPSAHLDAVALTGKSSSARLPQLVAMLSQHSKQVLADPEVEPTLWAECRARCEDCSSSTVDEISNRLLALLSGSDLRLPDRL